MNDFRNIMKNIVADIHYRLAYYRDAITNSHTRILQASVSRNRLLQYFSVQNTRELRLHIWYVYCQFILNRTMKSV